MFAINKLSKLSRGFICNKSYFNNYYGYNPINSSAQTLFQKSYFKFSSQSSSSQTGYFNNTSYKKKYKFDQQNNNNKNNNNDNSTFDNQEINLLTYQALSSEKNSENSQQSLNDFKSYIQKLKDEDSKQFNRDEWDNKMMFKFLSSFIRRPYALEIIQEIELYVFSTKFQKACLDSEMVTVKYSLFALHVWLIKNRLSEQIGVESFRIQRSLDKLFEDYTKDVVYQFQDYFDKDVYAELLRMKRTLFYSLDDYYIYQNKERDLSDIIIDEVLLGSLEGDNSEKEIQIVESLINYIEQHKKYLKCFSASDFKQYKIFWGLDKCYGREVQ